MLADMGADDGQLHALQREATANKTLYETFLNRFKETSSTQGLAPLLETEAPLIETETPPEVNPLPPSSNGEISPEVAQQMDLIQMQVIQERGLKPAGEFTRVLMTPDELRQRVLDAEFGHGVDA